MIIKNINIENFQSYYNSQTLEFSKGLNLIIGNGGKGKSKLFNAFYWVLFGQIYINDTGWCSTDTLPHSAKFAMKRQDFINKKALFETAEGEDVRTSVHIELEDDQGMIYEIERSVSAHRVAQENWEAESAWEVSSNTLKVSHDSRTGTKVKIGIMATDAIDALFPEGIRNYIWFQGESLDSLINFRNKETLKAAVKHISYFPYYEKVSEIISKSKIKIQGLEYAKISANNKNNKNIKALLTTIDALRYKIQREIENKDRIENNISQIQIALTEDEGKMSGLARFTNLVNDYNKCDLNLKDVMNQLTALDEYQRKQVPNLWILKGVSPMIEKCQNIIKNHTEVQNTAPEKKYLDNPGRTKLEEILRDKTCFVCGSEVHEDSHAHSWILNRLKEQEGYLREMEDYRDNLEFSKQFERFVGSIQDYPSSLKISLDSIEKQYTDSEEKIEKLQAQKRQYLDKKKKLDEQLEEIKKKYGVNPLSQAHKGENIESTIKGSRSSLEREQRKLTVSQEIITQSKSQLKEAEKDLDKVGKKMGGIAVSETEWKNISIFLEDICKRVQENARKDLLSKIESRANEFYKKFTEHDNGYKGEVKIGNDYSIEFDAGLNTSHEELKAIKLAG